MNDCPCCTNLMLRHIRNHEVYWFCRHCWQVMPNWNTDQSLSLINFNQDLSLSQHWFQPDSIAR